MKEGHNPGDEVWSTLTDNIIKQKHVIEAPVKEKNRTAFGNLRKQAVSVV